MGRYILRAVTAAALVFMAAVIGVIGAVFLAMALYLALLTEMAPPFAALLTGVAIFGVAGLIVIAGCLAMRRPARPTAPAVPSAAVPASEAESYEEAMRLGAAVGTDLSRWTRARPGSAMLAALGAGFVVGASPAAKKKISDVLGSITR